MVRNLFLRNSVLAMLVSIPVIPIVANVSVDSSSADISSSFIDRHNVAYSDEFYCGPLCLRAALGILGVDADLQDVATCSGLSYNGTSLYGLKKGSESFGVNAKVMDRKDDDVTCPFIAFHAKDKHFALILARSDTRMKVYIPGEETVQAVGIEKFKREYDCAVLCFSRANGEGRFGRAGLILIVLGVTPVLFVWVSGRRKVRSVVQCLVCFGATIGMPIYADEPSIAFEQTLVDFGVAPQFTNLNGSFRFSNEGYGDLMIRNVKTSCQCVTGIRGPSSLTNGQASRLDFSLNTKAHLGRREVEVLVETNDPRNPFVLLKAVVQVEPEMFVAPNHVDFCWTFGDTSSRTRYIEFSFLSDGYTLESILANCRTLKASVRPELKTKSNSEVVAIEFLGNPVQRAEQGVLTIQLKTPEDETKTVSIPWRVNIYSPLSLCGGAGVLGSVAKGSHVQECVGMVDSGWTKDMKVLSVQGKGLAAEFRKNCTGCYILAVAFEASEKGTFSGNIKVALSNSLCERCIIEVPIAANVYE
ncbi:MAG: cysteine peptidase family C39 domain-containing protein [Candidatus Hydrogenedentales bacterium]|jgi:hypothetical protein